MPWDPQNQVWLRADVQGTGTATMGDIGVGGTEVLFVLLGTLPSASLPFPMAGHLLQHTFWAEPRAQRSEAESVRMASPPATIPEETRLRRALGRVYHSHTTTCSAIIVEPGQGTKADCSKR